MRHETETGKMIPTARFSNKPMNITEFQEFQGLPLNSPKDWLKEQEET